ncbi:MAG: 4Fe-4S cluster-binding domain-containing protein [Leptospiraceae bacterium]|nr:4Fe-4S cluster-binding domain-containing protein [Leptospiraceae bacterium]
MIAKVNEIFYSLSGEGVSQGIPTVFIRLAGCSLRCGLDGTRKLWCDTGYALSDQAGKEMSLEEVLETVESYSATPTQILLTGGEPLEGEKKFFCAEFAKMVSLKRHNSIFAFTRVETNGKENIQDLKHMVFSIDYKLPGSGMESEMNRNNFHFIKDRNNPLDEVKFVIRDRIDFERSLEVIQEFKLNQNLIYSSVYKDLKPAVLADWLKENNILGAKFSIQLHKYLWGEVKGV